MYKIVMIKNGGHPLTLGPRDGEDPLKSFNDYTEWYSTSPQRKDNEFEFQFINEETGKVHRLVYLPMTNK